MALVLMPGFDIDNALNGADATVISNSTDSQPTFRDFLTAGKTLRVNDKRFWKELRFFMPEPAERLEAGHNYNERYIADDVPLLEHAL